MAATVRLAALTLLAALAASCAPAATRSAAPGQVDPAALRTLVLMVDGVPHQLMDSLYRAGHFRGFGAPSQVVSAFPSLTGVAFGDIWHERPAGYEDRYFDAESNRIRGGLLDHLVRPEEHVGFQRHVDVQADGISSGLTYLFPGPFASLELRGLRRSLLEHVATDSVVVAYLVSTDALAHREGREAVVEALLAVESMVDEVRRRAPRARVVLFSDHGNDLVPSRRVELEEALEAAGLNPSDHIEGPDDVVVPRFGLVGSAFVYAGASAEPRLAHALVPVQGVDLVMFEDALGRIHLWSRKGRAVVEHSPGRGYRYAAESGDPLGLLPAAARLRSAGRLDADGFASDDAWLEASRSTAYIDALRRIVHGMRTAVIHPASVMVSFEAGWHFGAPAADLLVDVTGTHGSLQTSSSLAFFMSTHDAAPPLMRSADVFGYLPVRR